MADTPYQLDKELMIVPVCLTGKAGIYDASFVLDTGCSGVIMDHSIALALGYSSRDGLGLSSVSSVLGKEIGYRLQLQELEALGQRVANIEVACHDLMNQGIEGLPGMTFLKGFNWCVYPQKQMLSTS